MSRRVLWHRRAIADLLNVADWQTAARIDAEVLYFAESGRGTVRRVPSEDGPDELRLYARPSSDDVAYFTEVRRDIEPQWLRGLRSDELFYKAEEEELTDAEKEELAQLDEQPRGPNWEDLFNRAERCIANWCLTNTALIDREGKPVTEGGVSDVIHIFQPSPPPPPCPLCNGKGWIAPTKAGDFPSMCSCKK